jgi:hypothetical protein
MIIAERCKFDGEFWGGEWQWLREICQQVQGFCVMLGGFAGILAV